MYTEKFKAAVKNDILKRLDEDENFAYQFGELCQNLDENSIRNIAYEKYAQKPEFKKYLEQEQGYFSKVGDDLSNIGKAWNAGNFYSHGGWNDIAKNIINGGTAEDREKLFQNYLKWESQNQMPQNKTIVGDVVNGIANLVPLTVDMLPEAAKVGGATGAVSAVGGSVIPGIGTVASGIGGFKVGATASMIEQSYKVGVADIYTALRKDGIDDETAKNWAIWAGIPYGALEYTGKAFAPISRTFLKGKVLKEFIDKISDEKIKNKILNTAVKYGADVALTGTLESGTEGGQAGVVELAKQGAKGNGYDAGKVVSEAWNEAKAVAPAMYGMAGLGIPLEATANRIANRTSDKKNVQDAIIEGKDFQPVPQGVKFGETFKGTDGRLYRNVDGYAMPVIEEKKVDEGFKPSDTDNLDEDAKNDSYEKTPVQNPEEARKLFFKRLEGVPNNEVGSGYVDIVNLAQQREAFERAKEKELQEQEYVDSVEKMIEQEQRAEKRAKKLQQYRNKLNRKNRISDRIANIDRVDFRLEAMENEYEQGNIDKLTDDQLYEAYEHGYDWAETELKKREEESSQGVKLLDFMRENGIKLPTPAAILRDAQQHGRDTSSYLYGEIKDLYDSLPKDKQLKYFSKNNKSLDEVAEELADYGFYYDSEADFISDVAENLWGRKVSTGGHFSLADKDYSKMSDQELIEVHAKAERANDIDNGRAITDEWLKRKGYKTDVYHGSPKNDITEFKEESYFTKDKDYAKRYKRGENGKIYETKLNLKKPFDTRNPKERAIFEKEFYRKWGNGAPLLERGLPDWTDGSDLLEFLDENGYDYDGIILDEGADGGYGETVKQRGESYVPRNASQIKSREAFTYGDDGKYIPLDKRGDINNPDVRFSIKEDDAQRFKNELQDYIDGKLDNKHVFRLGTTPEAMKLVGADDLPIELSAVRLSKKEVKHDLNIADLKDLPVELADPVAIFQSEMIPNGLVVLTELPSSQGNSIIVAVHLNYQQGKAEINSVRSVHPRPYGQLLNWSEKGDVLYLNTKKKPSWLKVPVLQLHGQLYNKNGFNRNKIFTQEDLSQEEKDNIFKLRGENKNYRYSVSDGNSNSKAESIKQEVLNIKSNFDKKAKHKSNVDIVGTVNEAREFLNTRNIPYNARGIQTGEKIVLVAENLDDAETGARVFLHEQVGHFGLRGLLGKDLRPFLNYVIKHYKGTDAWNKITSKADYTKQGDYAIAEEVLAHLSENRELSDPSMWKRLVHKVKRALWGNGVAQEYVNLLDEDVLCSAIVLSREWAKGDHYLNANGVWESVKNSRRAKDAPEEENFSLNDSETQKQYDEVVAKYKDTPLWMKAPNGKDTKLTAKQWVWVRTPNFKKWFCDWENNPANASKVVDENGEPLVVYHGTDYKFNIFEANNASTDYDFPSGMYFSSSRDIAKTYTSPNLNIVISSYLKIKNPLVLDANGRDYNGFYDELYSAVKGIDKDVYDGIIVHNIRDDWSQRAGGGEVATTYVVFKPNQIKSATDNVGTYDNANDDIRFSFRETRSQEELDELNAKFRDLYEQYKNGDQDAYKQAVELVNAEAERKRYAVEAEGRLHWINGKAPTANFEADEEDYSTSIWQYATTGRDPINFEWLTSEQNLNYNRRQNNKSDIESIIAFRNAVETIKRTKGKKDVFITIYRAVPSNVKDTKIRNGDWITLSPTYAKEHAEINGFYNAKIIKQKVNVKYVWNDSGDSINEFGYDDGNNYVYKNTKNNLKLQDPFTFDDNGELIPLTERFDEGNPDMRFSIGEEEELSDKEKEKLYKQKRVRELITSKAGRTVQATTDAFSALADLESVIYGKVRDASKSAWKMALMTRNLDQVMFHLFNVGGIQYNKENGSFSYRKGTKGLNKILKPIKGKNYKNFKNYALAKSAIERWAKLRQKKFYADKNFNAVFGFSLEDAKKWVAEGSDVSKKVFAELQDFFKTQRDFMLETGIIGEAQYKVLSEFKNYIPFFREGEDLDLETQEAFDRAMELNPGGRGFSGRDSGIQKFKGSARKTKNIVENIVNQARHVMDSGYKNIAMYRSLNLMREIGMAQYLKQDSIDVKAKLVEMKRALEDAGVNVGELSDEEILRKVPIEAFADISAMDEKTRDNIVSVRVNGTLRFYKVEDPELLVAIKNFGGEKFNVAWKILTIPKNIMTWGITKLPDFACRNFLRDTGSNAVLFGGKSIAPYLAKTMKNGVKTAFLDSHMKKVWASGAGGGTWYSVNAGDVASDFKTDTWSRTKRVGKYIVRPVSWLFKEYERRVLIPSEQANRMTVFENALEKGASDMEAAFQAMDVLNFGMHGSGVWTGDSKWAQSGATIFNRIVRITPFLNARIQGLYKLWRESGMQDGMFAQHSEFGLKNRTKAFIKSISKAVLMRGLMLAGTSIAYSIYANSSKDDDDEEWYKKLPASDKINYWHFYIGNNTIIRIPKPFEIGYVFGTIPETMTDALLQERPDTLKVLRKGITSALEFDPMSNPILDTFREQISNKDSFSSRPIIQQSDRDLAPQFQYDQSTSATAKAIAKVFGSVGLSESWLASPARVQNAIGNFLCGMTRYIVGATDAVVESLTDIEGGTSRYAREDVYKSIYSWATRNTKTMNTRNNEDFYELREHVREIYASARVLRQEGRLEEVQNVIDRHKGELGNYKLVEAVNTRLNEISRKRKSLGNNKALSNAEIIAKDDELIAERNRVLGYVDILIDRVEQGKYETRHFREILKRIENAGKDKKDSRNTRMLLRELSDMR